MIKYKYPKNSSIFGKYIKSNNNLNIFFSTVVFFVVIYFGDGAEYWYGVLFWLVFFRFISRSVEIMYAFGKDVTSNDNPDSDLTKFDRINLALKSYVEIYIYSSALYFLIIFEPTWLKAISMSFGVGTLTNVSEALEKVSECHEWFGLLIYFQVFTTLSLIVLSLAVYVSREK